MDMAMNNGHDVAEDLPTDEVSVASSEEDANALPSPSSLADEEGLTANGMVASTRPKEQTDRFGFTGGKQFTKDSDWNTPVQVIRRREIKWLDMLDDWDKWMNKKPKKVRERCRKGIPCSIRPRAWQYLCGSKKLYEQNKARWQELDSSEGDPKWIEVIQKDLDRQFPFHEMFASRDGHGQQDLFRILKAYSIYNPRDGYCQAQAPVAAVLLMHMPAEDAFWALVQICEKYLTGYYSVGLEAVQIDGMVLAGLTKKESPTAYKHLKKHKIDPILYMTEWFMCMFSRTLPWPSVLRVWDMFFCEGVKVLFRVALVLLKFTLGRSEQLKDCQGLYETMEVLRNIPASVTQEDFLSAEMLKLRVFERDMEAEHSLSLARRKVIKERQLAPEKAAAMQRDIDNLRKKKRGKVKPPPNRERTEGFGSQDLLAMDRHAELKHKAHAEHKDAWVEVPPEEETEQTPHVHPRSPMSDLSSERFEMVREIHVDNPPRDWNRNPVNTPVSPGAEKLSKSKDSKKDERKKEKSDKKKGKEQTKAEVTDAAALESVSGDKEKGKISVEKKDKKSKSKEKKEEKKAKKAEKADKKQKEKAGHSSSQPLSLVEDQGHHHGDVTEETRRLSNGSNDAGRKTNKVDHATEVWIGQTEYRMSPYANVSHPETVSTPIDLPVNDSLPGSPMHSPAEEQETHLISSRQTSQHHDHHDDQSPQPSIGLETPV
ncbi:TBC1 domain family member 10A-like [Acanthaster planci]|uniref:TBC1 domain family member 10A-like n=1 Tax=Acanthaster planci TaxID=133434 RepID=A0A8B7Z8X9_ACAPL|nr:TBC1 domain family member 10A-like [Acanthaster planci]